ncbi:hypothetical protein SK128_017134, partial [Halocaridina rubra]
MAALRLALAHTYENQPTSNMWYAHNYAQRRTHARNYNRHHYLNDYAHNVNTEYAHTAPPPPPPPPVPPTQAAVYALNPYHMCQDRQSIEQAAVHSAHSSHINPNTEFTRTAYRDYVNEYSQLNTSVLTHPPHMGVSQQPSRNTHTSSSNQRRISNTQSGSHTLSYSTNQRRGLGDTQNIASHIGDVDLNQYAHSARTYAHDCHYGRDQTSGRTSRHHAQEQNAPVHSYSREQTSVSGRGRHHSTYDEDRRTHSRGQDVYALYPDFTQSSEDDDIVLEDDIRVDLPYTHFNCRGRSAREEYSQGRTEHIIRRFEDPPEPCVTEDLSTVGLSYQQRADVCTTQGHPTPTGMSGSDVDGVSDGRAGLLIGEGLVREWVRAVGVVAASGTLVTLVVLGFG